MSPADAREFFKMTGSGNDFVFFDNRQHDHDVLVSAEAIARICDRRNGVGADGIVLIDTHPVLAFGMRYYNRDGSLAEMCGNAALCSARFATILGIVGQGTFTFETPSGPVTGRVTGTEAEVDMVPTTDLQPDFSLRLLAGELRAGYARVGVPHVVVECEDVTRVSVEVRGRSIRQLPELRDGANANFLSRIQGGWRIRTYERGVEQETLACGTGAVAAAALLNAWGQAEGEVTLETASGRRLRATPGRDGTPPVLKGEGRLVFTGHSTTF
jgi:diaminopimelate epimerase